VLTAEGYIAIVLQHEIDHLSGILFYDRIDSNDPWKQDEEALVI
jgi:peptide deformylase